MVIKEPEPEMDSLPLVAESANNKPTRSFDCSKTVRIRYSSSIN